MKLKDMKFQFCEGLCVNAGKLNLKPQSWHDFDCQKMHLQLLDSWTLVLLTEQVSGSRRWGGGKAKGQCGDQTCFLRSRWSLPIRLGNVFRNAPDVAANLVAPLLPFWGCWLRTNFTWRLFLSNIYYGNILFTTCPKPVKHEKANLSNVFFLFSSRTWRIFCIVILNSFYI